MPYGEDLPKRATFFRLEVYKRIINNYWTRLSKISSSARNTIFCDHQYLFCQLYFNIATPIATAAYSPKVPIKWVQFSTF